MMSGAFYLVFNLRFCYLTEHTVWKFRGKFGVSQSQMACEVCNLCEADSFLCQSLIFSHFNNEISVCIWYAMWLTVSADDLLLEV